MHKLVFIPVALILLLALPRVGEAAWIQEEHGDDKQAEHKGHDPLHGQMPEFPPGEELKGKGHVVSGPSIFASSQVGIVFFIVGMVGWVALGAATFILLQKQGAPTPS